MKAASADMARFYAPQRVHCASMRAVLFLCVVGIVAISGCGDKRANVANVPDAPTPAGEIYEQLRSGVFQINAGLDSIEAALGEAKKASPSTSAVKESLADIQASIDSAGDGLGEEAAEEPQKGTDLPTLDARRKKLIDLVNDSLHDLRDARGIVNSLAGESGQGPLDAIGIKIDVAMDDLKGALEALGGKEAVEG
ncbi:MAG: hypothetical protein H7Y17_15600 [Chlorobia bacterium]|nr:hypothetical protein [Fimbriimonadaceae bacterium]